MAAFVIGVDEVGRGSWAGPMVAAAVKFKNRIHIQGLRDSKRLSATSRAKFAKQVRTQADQIAIGWVSNQEIDKHGLSWANKAAMIRALEQIDSKFSDIITDGKFSFLENDYGHAQAIVKADESVLSVSAASVIAKVARDNYMLVVGKHFPKYGFERHVGYGTALHAAALKKFGPCRMHRASFSPVKQALESNAPLYVN